MTITKKTIFRVWHYACILFALFVLLDLAAKAQTGAPVDINGFPTSISQSTRFFDYSGTDMIYVCYARSLAPNNTNPGYNFSLSVTGTTLTSVVVATNVGTVTTVSAHGLRVAQKVVISGSTTSALNGTYYVQSVTGSTTFTITTSGVMDGTYNNGALTLSGAVPLLTGAIWSIEKLSYDGSHNLTDIQWAGGTPGAYTKICSNRAVTTGATAIYYQ